MRPLTITSRSADRSEVLRAKRGYGAFYGTVIGIAFAISAWGWDALLLSQAHGLQPWLKLLVGILLCAIVGRIAGWLVMRLDRSIFSIIIWLFPALIFAWLTVVLPLQIVPRILTSLGIVPVSLPYIIYDELLPRFGVAFVWVAIFVLIAGLLELPMGEPATFSTSIIGRISPVLVCIALMGIAGFIVDNLSNEPLRNAVVAMNQTVQFAVEHQGETLDPKVSRDMHQASLRTISELIARPRKLVVGQYDRELGNIHVLIKFGGEWVDCLTVYEQPSNCKKITP